MLKWKTQQEELSPAARAQDDCFFLALSCPAWQYTGAF
jgi:hypothetical protein